MNTRVAKSLLLMNYLFILGMGLIMFYILITLTIYGEPKYNPKNTEYVVGKENVRQGSPEYIMALGNKIFIEKYLFYVFGVFVIYCVFFKLFLESRCRAVVTDKEELLPWR
ncbi:MAG: hypothetical protein WAX69_02620 [Victivallales bacterium]